MMLETRKEISQIERVSILAGRLDGVFDGDLSRRRDIELFVEAYRRVCSSGKIEEVDADKNDYLVEVYTRVGGDAVQLV